MDNEYCIGDCDPKKSRVDGNCGNAVANDGYVARCGSAWTIEKGDLIDKYMGIFSNGMKDKYKVGGLNYIDLFAGPGKFFDRTKGVENTGSPLLALEYEFRRIFLNDLNLKNVAALRARTTDVDKEIQIYGEDAKKVAKKINYALPANSLSFCLLDPDNMKDLKFSTIEDISANKKKVDLLINFAYGMDYRRSSKYLMAEESDNLKFDEFFGTKGWRDIERKFQDREDKFRANALIELYITQLEKIGYLKSAKGERHKYIFPIHNLKGGLLYYLIFVSKHVRGYDFCRKIRPYTQEQQELL